MKHIVKIAFLMLGAVMILTSCDRNRHTPDPGAQGVPISFSALSQEPPVKASESTLNVDFGVWGIARYKDKTKPEYIPWLVNNEGKMAKVSSQGVPETGGYWFSGYTYNFIALAPYDLGTSSLTFTKETDSTNDALTLEFSMADKYKASQFDYDLMGAVGEQTVADAKNAVTQKLFFWHLLAKIRIKVSFANLPTGSTGSVTGLRLHEVATKRTYSITDVISEVNTAPEKAFKVTYDTTTDGQQPMTITLDSNDMLTVNDSEEGNYQYKIVHIIPQSIGHFELDLDFKIDNVQTNGYKLNLDAAKYDKDGNAVKYLHNQWYNWNITITPKGIGFDVTVTPWEDATDDNSDFEFDFEEEQE